MVPLKPPFCLTMYQIMEENWILNIHELNNKNFTMQKYILKFWVLDKCFISWYPTHCEPHLVYLDGLIMPVASLRIVRFVLLAIAIPIKPRADSTMFLATFGRVGRALLPIWQSASTVKCSNLTSTVGSLIPTLKITTTREIS